MQPIQPPHRSAETTGKALSTILHGKGTKEALYPAHTAGVARGFLSSFVFGGSHPTKAPWATPCEVYPWEYFFLSGRSRITELPLHTCRSPEVSPSRPTPTARQLPRVLRAAALRRTPTWTLQTWCRRPRTELFLNVKAEAEAEAEAEAMHDAEQRCSWVHLRSRGEVREMPVSQNRSQSGSPLVGSRDWLGSHDGMHECQYHAPHTHSCV